MLSGRPLALTWEQSLELIRRIVKDDPNRKSIAREYGVSTATIYNYTMRYLRYEMEKPEQNRFHNLKLDSNTKCCLINRLLSKHGFPMIHDEAITAKPTEKTPVASIVQMQKPVSHNFLTKVLPKVINSNVYGVVYKPELDREALKPGGIVLLDHERSNTLIVSVKNDIVGVSYLHPTSKKHMLDTITKKDLMSRKRALYPAEVKPIDPPEQLEKMA